MGGVGRGSAAPVLGVQCHLGAQTPPTPATPKATADQRVLGLPASQDDGAHCAGHLVPREHRQHPVGRRESSSAIRCGRRHSDESGMPPLQ